jgi:cysteinyl-tRNA synthetase
MINSLLGKQIDIHTGGIEHISIHHNNEIAQSEAATGKKPLSRFWLHREHIRMDNAKLSKSTGHTAYLSDIIEKGYHPLALRYWFLTSHYRTPSNFTWDALEAAQKALVRLNERMNSVQAETDVSAPPRFLAKFMEHINDDLDTPGALAYVWESLKDESLSPSEIKAILREADSAFGLSLSAPDEHMRSMFSSSVIAVADVPKDVRVLVEEREAARKEKDWAKADELRAQIETLGFAVKDSAHGPQVSRN